MKIKNIILFLTVFVVTNKAYSAVVSVYNAMNQPVGPQIFWCVSSCNSFNKNEKWQQIGLYPANHASLKGGESKQRFNNGGAYSFTKLRWLDPSSNRTYEAMIPSSPMMLMGTIVLRENGFYSINFDKDGASDKKVRTIQAMPI